MRRLPFRSCLYLTQVLHPVNSMCQWPFQVSGPAQGEVPPFVPQPSRGEETPISQDGMSYRVRSLPSSLFHPSNRALRRSSGKVTRGSSLARVSYQLLLAAPRSCLLEPFGPSPVHVCAKPVRNSSPGFAFTGGQRAACRVCLRLLLAKD